MTLTATAYLSPWQRAIQPAIWAIFMDWEAQKLGVLWTRPLGRYVLTVGVLPADNLTLDQNASNIRDLTERDGSFRLTQYKRVVSVLQNPETPPVGKEHWEFTFEAVLHFDASGPTMPKEG